MLKGNISYYLLSTDTICVLLLLQKITLIGIRIQFENSNKKTVTLGWHLTSRNHVSSLKHVVFTKWRGGDEDDTGFAMA